MRYLALKTVHILLAIAMLLATGLAGAEIYTWKDADGNTVYSDRPAENATEVKLPELQTVPATKPTTRPPAAPQAQKPEEDADSYRELAISEPADEQDQWASNGQVDVVVAIEPALMVNKGHYLSLTLDGKPRIEQIRSTHMTLTDIDRGTHQLAVTVHASNGDTLKTSDSITFHIHRPSLLNK